LAELADALGIEQFALSGYSGGGPYAIAAAAKLPQRVRRVAVAAGMGQIGEWAEIADFEKTDRQFLAMAKKQPHMAQAILSITARLARLAPKTAVKSFVKELSESDRRVLADMGPPTDAIALFTQAFLKGAGGVVDDYRAIGQLWGVDPATIDIPVMVLQGDADTMVPLRHSEELAKRIPGAELVVWRGEGHLGPIAHVGEILDFLNADVGR
jgi:pimeloyl-ACP methyl ester carboxylesterase